MGTITGLQPDHGYQVGDAIWIEFPPESRWRRFLRRLGARLGLVKPWYVTRVDEDTFEVERG